MRNPKNFEQLVDLFISLVNLLIPLVFALTLAFVIWKVTKTWIIEGGDPSSIESGKQVVLASVIALVVMASIWGILSVLRASLF